MLATGRSNGNNGRGPRQKPGQGGAATRFEVQNRVGEGSLWVVYRVRDRATGQIMALKALKGAFNRHPRLVASLFEANGQLLDISHPNLAALEEIGEEDGTLYQASEWLPGGSLEAKLGRGPMSHEETVEAMRGLAGALRVLHEKGLFHGDVRPRQLLKDAKGNLKLTDAGVAAAMASAGLALADVQSEAAQYLAPERTQGASISAQSDLYAAGVVMYRMLAGRVPFDGSSPLAVAQRHRNDTPLAPSQLNPRCAPDLEAIALKLMAKNPADRFQSAAELEQTLGASFNGTVVHAPVAPVVASVVAPVEDDEIDAIANDPLVAPPPVKKRRSDDPDLDFKTRKRRHHWREFWGAIGALIWLFIVAGALGGLFYGAYYFWVNDLPPEVQVPKYVGLPQENARKELFRKGLMMKVTRETYDPKKPAGTVIAGNPPPGKTVRARREVNVTISQGQKPIEMYDFKELSLKQARQIISQHGLRLGPISEQFHARIPKGYICGQFPMPGEPLRRADPINLIVSRGPQPSDTDPALDPLPSQTLAPELEESPTPAPNDQSDSNGAALVTRAAVIRVVVPSDGNQQVVKIIVTDAEGEHTVYSKLQRPGVIVQETIKVTRAQGTTASIQVFVGDDLIKEQTL